MSAPVAILVGRPQGAHACIVVNGREHPAGEDPYGWLRTEIEIAAGAFRGSYTASLLADELASFRDGLAALEAGAAEAHLGSSEGWLLLDVGTDERGHLHVEGRAADGSASGNTLAFRFALERSRLPAIIASLDQALDAWPPPPEPSPADGAA